MIGTYISDIHGVSLIPTIEWSTGACKILTTGCRTQDWEWTNPASFASFNHVWKDNKKTIRISIAYRAQLQFLCPMVDKVLMPGGGQGGSVSHNALQVEASSSSFWQQMSNW